MSPSRSFALAILVLALGACQQESAAPTEADAGSAAAPAPAAGPVTLDAEQAAAVPDAQAELELGTFRIVSVLLGNAVDADKLVMVDSNVFARKDPIYASVLSTGAHQGLRMSAKWLAPDGAVIAETIEPVVPTAATATTFSISNPERWPVGNYQVLIGVNGHTLDTKTFKVR